MLFVFENVYYPASDRIYFYLFANNGEKMIGKDTEELPPVLTETHFIRAHECGVDGLLKLHVLLDYLQDIAASHAELLNVGMSSLTRQGTLWVLSRLSLEIDRYPACDEKIILKSYPSGISGLFATREYVMRDENDNILAKGTSFWLVLDAKTFRPVKAVDFLPENMPQNENEERFFPDLGKIVKKEVVPQILFTVRHGDIDMNKHLNNAVFSRMIFDTLCKEKNSFLPVRKIQINFISSGELGTEILFGSSISPDGNFYLHGLSPDGKKIYIQAEGKVEL